jgi:hypothetical protein
MLAVDMEGDAVRVCDRHCRLLFLDGNQLTGPIPESLGLLTGLW